MLEWQRTHICVKRYPQFAKYYKSFFLTFVEGNFSGWFEWGEPASRGLLCLKNKTLNWNTACPNYLSVLTSFELFSVPSSSFGRKAGGFVCFFPCSELGLGGICLWLLLLEVEPSSSTALLAEGRPCGCSFVWFPKIPLSACFSSHSFLCFLQPLNVLKILLGHRLHSRGPKSFAHITCFPTLSHLIFLLCTFWACCTMLAPTIPSVWAFSRPSFSLPSDLFPSLPFFPSLDSFKQLNWFN